MSKNLFYILMVFAMIFWGASWISTKVLTNYINEYELVFLRMGICFITLFPIIYFFKFSFKLDIKSFFLVLIASLVLTSYSISMFIGLKHGSAGFGGALVTTLIPINTFIIVAILSRKTISLKHSFALLLGAFGVLNMLNIWNFNLNEIFSKDTLYFLLSSILWPILTLITAKAAKIHAFVFTFYTYIISSVVLIIFFVDTSIFERVVAFDFIFWFNLFVITILSTTFATSIYFIGATKLGTKEVSSFIFLVPATALIIGAIFLGEKITLNTVIGTVFTIIAIYILNNLSFLKLFKKKI
ncbi:MAG: DMT family transporter [Aliarcobacter sp.]|nr:DMT family transporter [Aliarcobacter sp.]MBP6712598.1 DMT family transporter [Aliarcobacter sp.]MBP7226445.1 DMT family transporter [Aliarcobacter sp.]